MNTCYVIDSCVLVKLFLDEDYAAETRLWIGNCVRTNIALYAPFLCIYEIYNIMARHGAEADYVYRRVDSLCKDIVQIVTPTQDHLMQAYSMIRAASVKTGMPSLYDSLFHVIALEKQGIFVTADVKYFEKTKHYGQSILLSELVK